MARELMVEAPTTSLGPTGTSLGYPTVAAKAGDVVELFGTGFGPTNPAVLAGQAFSGAAPTTNPVTLRINNVSVTPGFTGLSGAGLYQINLTVPAGLGTGDVTLQAKVGGVADSFWRRDFLAVAGLLLLEPLSAKPKEKLMTGNPLILSYSSTLRTSVK